MKAIFVALVMVAACGLSYGQVSKAPAPVRAGPGPVDAALIAAARVEGSVSMYATSSVAALESDVKAFEAAYGIRATYLQLTSGPLSARIDQEIKAGHANADVIITADVAALDRWAAGGQLARLPEFSYPARTEYLAVVQAIY